MRTEPPSTAVVRESQAPSNDRSSTSVCWVAAPTNPPPLVSDTQGQAFVRFRTDLNGDQADQGVGLLLGVRRPEALLQQK
ncbi:hypothetical protein PCANC_02240 [Puccinia coronata f. sp. avenae]|uniref:Uncharacterized protein n=1 Tax=Puccinia coronata f. sp. avenae TaxID=200324 RepID=A0A2N5W0Y5_9BASI|nr:hypothetical protein PCASD_12433 [Puccinia coronata f. sp. avenae]PLW55877.1 hypothetical protein PCANC_02240 [Puccinia coronata f. sp. avenae]